MAKRAFDVTLALLLLFMVFPLLLLIGLLISLTMGRPVFFVQARPGYKGEIFNLYKFRTMRKPKPDEDSVLSDGKRMSFFGRFLRNLSFDELPELFNVLKGDMSLVGPRPLLPQYLSRYTSEQARRHEVKPGITGWAQVKGRNAIDWKERFDLDVWYVDNRSIWLDLKILCLTIYKTIKREGISQPGQATCEEFRGGESGKKI